MLFGRECLNDLLLLQVHDGDRGLVPQTDIQPLALGIDQASIGMTVLAERKDNTLLRLIDGQQTNAVAPRPAT